MSAKYEFQQLGRGMPGLRGTDHIGITVPNLEQATDFFVNVIGCEQVYDQGPFRAADDWMATHLNVHPRAVMRKLRFFRCFNGSNYEVFEYESPDQVATAPRNSDVGGHHLALYVDDPTLATTAYGGTNRLGTTNFCERSCTSSSQCPLLYTFCSNSRCTDDFCGNASTGAGLFAGCDAGGTNDGTCYPEPNAAGTGVGFGLCFQDGTAANGAACNVGSSRADDPAETCMAGSLCPLIALFATPQCQQACNPSAGNAGCPWATPCVEAFADFPAPFGIGPDRFLGICEPP